MVVIAQLEIQNQTKWPWKRGCFIGLSDKNSKSEIVVSDIPMDFEVKGMQTFKLNVPLQIPENINLEKGDTFVVPLSFFGPKGNTFGQIIEIKIKVK